MSKRGMLFIFGIDDVFFGVVVTGSIGSAGQSLSHCRSSFWRATTAFRGAFPSA
jgi:hypothetical protein